MLIIITITKIENKLMLKILFRGELSNLGETFIVRTGKGLGRTVRVRDWLYMQNIFIRLNYTLFN
jgi:hypothetical protein